MRAGRGEGVGLKKCFEFRVENFLLPPIMPPEVGIYKRKQESKKTRKKELDQEKRKFFFFFSWSSSCFLVFLIAFLVEFLFSFINSHL